MLNLSSQNTDVTFYSVHAERIQIWCGSLRNDEDDAMVITGKIWPTSTCIPDIGWV